MREKLNLLKEYFVNIKERSQKEDGFTLIELLVVIAIVAILGAVAVPRLMDAPKKAKVSAAVQQIKSFELALDRYYLDNGFYPTSDQGLSALVSKPTSEPEPTNYPQGGYIKAKKGQIPQDPWKNNYLYQSPTDGDEDYIIISYGSDGQEGGENDKKDLRSNDL